jgi:2'-5' RNA ligase
MVTTEELPEPSARTPQARPPRIFVGLKIEPEIARELAQLARALQRFGIRTVAPCDIHLTLVPPWNAGSIPAAIDKLRNVVDGFGAFSLTFEHLGYGPQPRQPRLLWAECVDSNELSRLHAVLLEAYGGGDARPFRPHVTLARLRHNGRSIARKHPIDRRLAFVQRVSSVELFHSPPAGQRGYQVLASVPLAGETHSALASAAAASKPNA